MKQAAGQGIAKRNEKVRETARGMARVSMRQDATRFGARLHSATASLAFDVGGGVNGAANVAEAMRFS